MRLEKVSEDEIARKLHFGRAENMHHQLRSWGLSGLLPTEAPEHKDSLYTARGGGQRRNLRAAAYAVDIFEGVVKELSVFVERLPLRREYRQAERFVVTNAKPFLEVPEPGENLGYVEAPPDALPDEEGNIDFTFDDEHRVGPSSQRN
jgi:hypothetical protein